MIQEKFTRRRILGGLATLAVSSRKVRPVWSLPAEGSLSAGLFSEAGSHAEHYLKGFAQARGVGRVALSDPTGKTFEQAKKLLGGRLEGTYRSHREMLEKVHPKLVVVTLEGHHAPPAIRLALEANCHVMTEKPGCARLEDFEPLVELAESRGLDLMLAMATRVSLAVKKARDLIQSGYLGKPYSATMDWISDQTRLTRPEYQRSWLSFKDKAGGGKLIFHGIHYLDLIQFLTGDRIDRITSLCENVGGQPIEVEDAAVVSFRLSKGLVGTLNTGYYLDEGYQNQVRVWGSKGWFHLDLPYGETVKWYSTHPEAPRGVQFFRYQDDPNPPYLYGPLVQEAVDAALGLSEPPMTAQECLHLMRVIFAGYRAAESGRTQEVTS